MIKNLRLKLAEAGKLKIGGLSAPIKSRKGNTFRPPRKDDHWTVTGTTRDANGDLEVNVPLMDQLVADGYADSDGKIRTLPIVLHADEIDAVFRTSYARYQGRKCACSGDGETATKRQIDRGVYTGATKDITCPCELLESRRCKPHGKLLCSLRVRKQAVAGAVYCFRTTSIISIEQVVGSLTQILAAVGTLQGLPLLARVMPMTVTPEGRSTTVHVVHIELHAADLAAAQQLAIDRMQARSAIQGRALAHYQRMLATPETDEEAADVQREFYSEVEQEEQAAAGWDKPNDAKPPAWAPPQQDDNPMPDWAGGAAEPPHDPVTGEVPDPPPTPAPPSKPTVTITTPASSKTVTLTDPGPKPQGGDPPARGRRRYQCARCGDLFHGDHRVDGVCLWCLWAEETGDVTEAPAGQGELPTEAQPTPSERLDAIWQLGLDSGLDPETMKAIWPRDEGETLTPSHDLADKAEMVISALIEDKERAEREAGAE
jgi:hypothetical protein